MPRHTLLSPPTLPAWSFAAAILCGAALLHWQGAQATGALSWLDALFTATSAVCVTGLVVVDTGSHFNTTGQAVILGLIQLGGLGIMTYTSLVFLLWRKRVPLGDRIVIGQALLHDTSFSLGRFLLRVVGITLGVELVGALVLFNLDPQGFGIWGSVFHAVSAFCNAGFSLYADSLTAWRSNPAVNLVFMLLIVLGGLGFAVCNEGLEIIRGRCTGSGGQNRKRFSRHARIVFSTTAVLIVGGWAIILVAELMGGRHDATVATTLLGSLFQSVTARTAGFNTFDIGALTNGSLMALMLLMTIGGSPGSCAGGIKTTTLRAVAAFAMAQLRGRDQAVIRGRALDALSLRRALTLIVFTFLVLTVAVLLLSITETEGHLAAVSRSRFVQVLFEAVSAFGTVGLSTGITPHLSTPGKVIIILLMFIGRLGPISLLMALQAWRVPPAYRWPEDELVIG